MRRAGGALRRATSFAMSAAAHALCLWLLITLPTCGRPRRPEHKIYTIELFDPSALTMRKPEAPPAAPKKEAPKKEKKPAPPKEAAKKPERKPERKVVSKKVELPRQTIEERIKEQLAKIDHKDWAEPEEFQKAQLLDTGAFANAWYSDAVASKIYQAWRTPSRSAAEREGLAVVVRFRILRDGKVNILGVERKSGSDVLDASAIQAIREAQPLPPLPPDYRGDSLEVCMTFIPLAEE
ncbi:MAG: energy transducer TonB [bacterium]|nr:energy transducer TonB [bacterium]